MITGPRRPPRRLCEDSLDFVFVRVSPCKSVYVRASRRSPPRDLSALQDHFFPRKAYLHEEDHRDVSR